MQVQIAESHAVHTIGDRLCNGRPEGGLVLGIGARARDVDIGERQADTGRLCQESKTRRAMGYR
jgi:hypothetical protein